MNYEAPTPATQTQEANWLGEHRQVFAGTETPPDVEDLAPSQREFAAVVLGSEPDV